MNREQRNALVAFSMDLARAYPDAKVADALELLLSARRLKAHPTDAEEVIQVLAKGPFEVIAADGVLAVNMGGKDMPAWVADWQAVCHF